MRQQAFSLLELSIVLVIVGLIAGGITAGFNLIRAAEIRAVTTEYETWNKAIYTFRDKYRAWPGDMANATELWGAADGGDGWDDDCALVATLDSRTCNGNGDGMVDRFTGGNGDDHERFRFWQHLVNAGLIDGQYSGVQGPTGYTDSIIGTNVPASDLNGAGWTVRHVGPFGGDGNSFQGQYGTLFDFGNKSPTETTNAPAISPIEAYNIDKKLDDGRPAKGLILSGYWPACTNATSATSTDAEYLLTSEEVRCALYFTHILR